MSSYGFSKCFILFMASVILVEGLLYIGLALWGITQEKCSEQTTNIATDPFEFTMDLIYFANEDCGNPTVTTTAGTQEQIEMNWAESFVITNRMYIFMITYAVVSGLWVVSSLMVIVSICGNITQLVVGVCFWPWFLLVIAGSILDVVATVFFGIDIANTTSASTTFEYIGVTNSAAVLEYLQGYDAYFMTPALVMTCISSRVVLIWCLNLFGASFCLSLSKVLANKVSHNEAVVVTSAPDMYGGREPTAVAAVKLTAEPQQTMLVEEPYPAQIQPKPLPVQSPQPAMQRQSSAEYPQSPNQHSYEPRPQSPLAMYSSPSAQPGADNMSISARANEIAEIARQSSTAAEVGVVTYRNTETHPDRLDYPGAQTSASLVDVRATPPPSSELSAMSPLNHRYSTNDANAPYPVRESQVHVSDELRSQLPWSYTSMLTKPPVPRKPQVQIYPKIPEPDYADASVNTSSSANPTDSNEQQSYSRW